MGPAARLHALYIEELQHSLLPPARPTEHRSQTESLMERAHAIGPAEYAGPDATTWLWSDLHLGHEHSRTVFSRPFPTAAAADTAMMEAWHEQVADDETVICLGDVTVDGAALAHHHEWWRNAPGEKWLVLGNHDVDPINRIESVEIHHTAITLYAPGDPPLVLTHMPLIQVPYGTVNVHGHVHDEDSPTPSRHINVSVEQVDYRPVRLSEIRRLARRLQERGNVAGRDTKARLDMVERIMP